MIPWYLGALLFVAGVVLGLLTAVALVAAGREPGSG